MLEKDGSLVECVFKGNRYFHGNDYQKDENQVGMNFVRIGSVTEKLMPISKNMMYGKGNMQEEKILYVSFRINRANISNHAFCVIKLNGLKDEHYFNEIAPKDTKMRTEVIF